METVKLKILIWAINESESLMQDLCSRLCHTAKIFNIKVEFIGIGIKFIENRQRIFILRDYLKRIDQDTIIVCIDGADTLFNQGADQLVSKFKARETRILVSAEKAYSHQYQHARKKFEAIQSPYKYFNAGTFMGYAGDLLKMIKEVIEISKVYPKANDQGLMGLWVSERLSDGDLVKLDYQSEVFWVTTGDWKLLKENAEKHQYILNTNTHTKPTIIHCVGVGFAPHQKSYQSAYQNIISQKRGRSVRIAILSANPEGITTDNRSLSSLTKRQAADIYPIMHTVQHPNISVHFCGPENMASELFIPTGDIHQAVLALGRKYYLDYIVHIPSKKCLNSNLLFEFLREWTVSGIPSDFEGKDSPHSDSFIYCNDKYYSADELIDHITIKFDENLKLLRRHLHSQRKYRTTNLRENMQQPMNEFISLGGWCGPALALNALGLRKVAYPFCMMHTKPECLIDILNGKTDSYFDVGNFTLAPHHNFEKQEIRDIMNKRIKRFLIRLKKPEPITFVRTVIEPDFTNEFASMIEFMKSLEQIFKRKDRLLLILHDQGIGTVKVKMLDYRIMVWSARGSLRTKGLHRLDLNISYKRIIEYAMDENNWKIDEEHIRYHRIKKHETWGICKELYLPSKAKFYRELNKQNKKFRDQMEHITNQTGITWT